MITRATIPDLVDFISAISEEDRDRLAVGLQKAGMNFSPKGADEFPAATDLWDRYAKAREATVDVMGRVHDVSGAGLRYMALRCAQRVGQDEGRDVAVMRTRKLMTAGELAAEVKRLLGV